MNHLLLTCWRGEAITLCRDGCDTESHTRRCCRPRYIETCEPGRGPGGCGNRLCILVHSGLLEPPLHRCGDLELDVLAVHDIDDSLVSLDGCGSDPCPDFCGFGCGCYGELNRRDLHEGGDAACGCVARLAYVAGKRALEHRVCRCAHDVLVPTGGWARFAARSRIARFARCAPHGALERASTCAHDVLVSTGCGFAARGCVARRPRRTRHCALKCGVSGCAHDVLVPTRRGNGRFAAYARVARLLRYAREGALERAGACAHDTLIPTVGGCARAHSGGDALVVEGGCVAVVAAHTHAIGCAEGEAATCACARGPRCAREGGLEHIRGERAPAKTGLLAPTSARLAAYAPTVHPCLARILDSVGARACGAFDGDGEGDGVAARVGEHLDRDALCMDVCVGGLGVGGYACVCGCVGMGMGVSWVGG